MRNNFITKLPQEKQSETPHEPLKALNMVSFYRAQDEVKFML